MSEVNLICLGQKSEILAKKIYNKPHKPEQISNIIIILN